MDLTKIKLYVDPGCTYGGVPTYFLLKKGKARMLVTGPYLHRQAKVLYKQVRQADPPIDTGIVLVRGVAYPLIKGGYYEKHKGTQVSVPKGSLRVFRVHPNRLSEEQREEMVGPGEGGRYRAEFVEDGLTDKERRHRAQEATALAQADVTREEKAQRQAARNNNRGFNPNATLTVKDIAQRAQPRCEGFWPNYVYQFLRERGIGKRGGRYLFTNSEAEKITRAFINWWEEEDEE